MRRKNFEFLLWAAAFMIAVWSGSAWFIGATAPPGAGKNLPAAPTLQEPYPADLLKADKATLIETDPFRLERRPADVAYVPGGEHEPPAPAIPAPSRPLLTLTGTISGPPWAALIEGVPGREGSVLVREGEIVGELRITKVTRDSTVIVGSDTTWNLKLRRAWH